MLPAETCGITVLTLAALEASRHVCPFSLAPFHPTRVLEGKNQSIYPAILPESNLSI